MPALGRVKKALLRLDPLPMATPNLPPSWGALGSIRKPPAVELKLGVNSIARSSFSWKAFHFIQNSTVTWVVPERERFAVAASSRPSKLTAPSVSPEIAPGAPSVGEPTVVALLFPKASVRVVPLVSSMRQ